MAGVLIVEDSPEQARMVAALVEAAGMTVQTSPDGAHALATIEKKPPDIVVTDLIMPGMNGLELVEAVIKQFPLIPVILMTAYGSGEIAVQALKQGAASYVPKRRVQEELVDTIESTLALASAKREESRVLDFLERTEFDFCLENDQTLIPPLVGFLQQGISTQVSSVDDTMLMQLGIALQEALLNAMHHGNLETSSELRADDVKAYYRTIRSRQRHPAFSDRRVRVRTEISPNRLQCEVEDEGPGFDPSTVPDPTDASNLENVSGRGLYLITTFMDEVTYNDKGNRIVMVKRFGEAPA